MKGFWLVLLLLVSIQQVAPQQAQVDHDKVQQDLDEILSNITNFYVYTDQKDVDLECLREKYSAKISSLRTEQEVLLFFEILLTEFYDSHISLTSNNWESYRLWSPLYIKLEGDKATIEDVWQSQLEKLSVDIACAEVVEFNGAPLSQQIEEFPSLCVNKQNPEVREWLANKVIAGRYSQTRIMKLKLKNGQFHELDLDKLAFKQDEGLLSSRIENGIGIIRLNNSLGNNQLITAFDKAMDKMMETKGLILDLRNTNNGGNTYVAKGLMSRFVTEDLPYQKHSYIESFDGQPQITRSWIEYVSPRGQAYTKPVVVLIGRWTGSMGEGMAVGMDGMQRATLVGTAMKRLAGSDFDFRFTHQDFGYKLILQELYHINGTPREKYVPKTYVQQTTVLKDEILERGMTTLLDLIE